MSEMLDTWSIVEASFDVRNNRHYEGLLAIGSRRVAHRFSGGGREFGR